MYVIELIAGCFLLVLIFHDAFEVMLLPRRVRRRLRFITLLVSLHLEYGRGLLSGWHGAVAAICF
jgi:hypothetical protein